MLFFGCAICFLAWSGLPDLLVGGLITVAFQGWFWPWLGLIFLPWTTLVFPMVGLDWIWLGFAFIADIGAFIASAARRKDASWYTGP